MPEYTAASQLFRHTLTLAGVQLIRKSRLIFKNPSQGRHCHVGRGHRVDPRLHRLLRQPHVQAVRLHLVGMGLGRLRLPAHPGGQPQHLRRLRVLKDSNMRERKSFIPSCHERAKPLFFLPMSIFPRPAVSVYMWRKCTVVAYTTWFQGFFYI